MSPALNLTPAEAISKAIPPIPYTKSPPTLPITLPSVRPNLVDVIFLVTLLSTIFLNIFGLLTFEPFCAKSIFVFVPPRNCPGFTTLPPVVFIFGLTFLGLNIRLVIGLVINSPAFTKGDTSLLTIPFDATNPVLCKPLTTLFCSSDVNLVQNLIAVLPAIPAPNNAAADINLSKIPVIGEVTLDATEPIPDPNLDFFLFTFSKSLSAFIFLCSSS